MVNWYQLSADVSWETVKLHPTRPWDWELLSLNPNVTWEIVQENPDKPWNYNFMSMNPNITWDIIKQNPNKEWNWIWSFIWLNRDKTKPWMLTLKNKDWSYTNIYRKLT